MRRIGSVSAVRTRQPLGRNEWVCNCHKIRKASRFWVILINLIYHGGVCLHSVHSRHINFTGSTRVGSSIASIAGKHLKPTIMELGGKAPSIVLDDADMDIAANNSEVSTPFFFFNTSSVYSRGPTVVGIPFAMTLC